MMGTTPIASRGLTFMVIPDAVFRRSAEPDMGFPTATIPASSELSAADFNPILLSTYESMRDENLSPWETTLSL